MIAQIELPYTVADAVKALTEEEYGPIAEYLGWVTWEKHLETIEKKSFWVQFNGMVDLSILGPLLTANKIEFIVKRFAGTYHPKNYVAKLGGEDKAGEAPLHVHLPNVGLLSVEEVMVLEDACTDELQRHLDDQWRILCVCPPNSARRPDYVLGRPKDAADRTWTHGGRGRWV